MCVSSTVFGFPFPLSARFLTLGNKSVTITANIDLTYCFDLFILFSYSERSASRSLFSTSESATRTRGSILARPPLTFFALFVKLKVSGKRVANNSRALKRSSSTKPSTGKILMDLLPDRLVVDIYGAVLRIGETLVNDRVFVRVRNGLRARAA